MRKNLEQWKEELLNKHFGRLTVIDVVPYIDSKTGNKKGYQAVCQCSCGNVKEVVVNSLINGLTQSCGCLRKEVGKELGSNLIQWRKEHPEESKQIENCNIQTLLEWRKEHTNFIKQKSCIEKKKNTVHRIKYKDKRSINLLEHNKEKYVGKTFGRLLIKDIFLEEGKYSWDSLIAVCYCNCGNIKNILLRSVLSKNTKSCGCLSKEQAKVNVGFAHKWFRDNPEKAKIIWDKNRDRFLQFKKDHPDIFRQHLVFSLYQSNLTKSSKEELDFCGYLLSLEYTPERQCLVEDHYFDFRINNFLIEYNGSVYHCSEYKNIENPTNNPPRVSFKTVELHKNLRDLANRNGFHLIQIWDYDWIHKKEFVQKLLKDQLSGIADYKDYLDENNLLNNDYGFDIEGEQVEPKPFWVSTGYRQIVDEEYQKGKVLVYNSGYTKIKE